MGKQKSLFYQLKTACDTYIPHFDKHSDKRQDHDNSYVIKSLQAQIEQSSAEFMSSMS